jgi:hypothetical protein
MSLSIYIAQIMLRPQYHPSYSTDPNIEAGRPRSNLRASRKEKLYAISLDIGEARSADILDAMHETDPRIHKDDARKLLDELCAENRMIKRISYGSGKKVFYKAKSSA